MTEKLFHNIIEEDRDEDVLILVEHVPYIPWNKCIVDSFIYIVKKYYKIPGQLRKNDRDNTKQHIQVEHRNAQNEYLQNQLLRKAQCDQLLVFLNQCLIGLIKLISLTNQPNERLLVMKKHTFKRALSSIYNELVRICNIHTKYKI